MAPVNVPEITFDSGSAALSSDQAEQLATLGKVIRDAIDQNPNEMFMIEAIPMPPACRRRTSRCRTGARNRWRWR